MSAAAGADTASLQTRYDDAVLHIALDRPAVRNALPVASAGNGGALAPAGQPPR